MKKRVLAAAFALIMSLSLAACSKNTNIITGYKSGDVTLGQYKGVEYTPLSTEVTDEDIQKQIDSFVSSKAEKVEITGRTDVQDGDIANIDYTGYMNGETFEGGSAEGSDLTIGSGRFIEGFESGLIGVNVGETVDLQLKFPDPYQNNPDFAGKDVTFKVKVNGIYQNLEPKLTDEFIAANTESSTVAEYREYIAAQLKASLEERAESQKQYDTVNAVISNTTFVKDLTDEIKQTKESIIANYDSMYSSTYGVDAATFFQAIYGMSADAFESYMYEQAAMNTKFGYVSSAIVEKENINCTDEEISALAADMLENYGYNSVDELYAALKEFYKEEGKNVVAEQVKLNKAAQIIYDNAVVKSGETE